MDNVTHTLIGVATYRLLPERFRTRATFWAATLGNNVPDSDVLQRFWPGTDDLSYIVHHRGFTHSFAFAILLGFLVGAAANRVFKRPWNDRPGLLVGAGSGILHILADGMNSYGIHPWTPFDGRWFYGDSLFILEPLLWLWLLPAAYLAMPNRRGRALWIAVFAGLQYLIWSADWIGLTTRIALAVGGGAVSLALARRGAARAGIGLAAATIALFFGASYVARGEAVRAWEKTGLAGERLADVESTPSPGNPACWRVWLRTESETRWSTRLAGVSFFPDLVPPADCADARGTGRTAETTAPLLRPTPRVAWIVQSDLEKALHARVAAASCRYRRLLNFARLPFLADVGDDGRSGPWVAGDLRYDREEDLGFTEFLVGEDDDCGTASDRFWTPPSERRLGAPRDSDPPAAG